MRIAVTGANGLLGSEAVMQLAEGSGHEVLALGRGPCRLPPGRYLYASIDLGDGGSAAKALGEFQPEAVLHAGAATDVDACERQPELAWRVNVDGTAEVAGACRSLRARLLALSTDYVFDGLRGPYGEDDLPNPRGVYARTKRCAEEAALLLAPDAAVGRVAVVYGGRTVARATFASQVVERLSRGEPVRAFHDQLVSTTLASAGAARCLELLLDTDYRGVIHLSDATVLDRVELAQRIAERFGLGGEIVPVRTADARLAAPRPLRAGLKVDRAAALLRNRPLPIDQALERFHEEWLSRGARR
ncbi:MAG TPA: SDR family oxidoreductase [Anaeromyxobacter sp.]|nr:SDR family oxidoreductase [Anaeromyxobacter sp.]